MITTEGEKIQAEQQFSIIIVSISTAPSFLRMTNGRHYRNRQADKVKKSFAG